ncbi:MAG: arsenite methyltransferase [Thermoplasmata archaeon]
MTDATTGPTDDDSVRGGVRDRYGRIARSKEGCCGDGSSSDCGRGTEGLLQLGYTEADLAALPEGSNLGLGCGNPTALLSLQPGEVVVDLGSGAGIDCFLASKKVGPNGRVIGVDMTPEMVAKARMNARASGTRNVEFRLGEIEHLPVADRSADVVISNCVINLVPDKGEVYREAFRVLRPGGRLAVSDVVATRHISPEERADPALWSSCSSGALEVPDIRAALHAAGFEGIEIAVRVPAETPSSLNGQHSLGVVPADIRAVRPRE